MAKAQIINSGKTKPELNSKKTDESFEDAVKRIFLDGVPQNFCYYNSLDAPYKFDNPNFSFGSIFAGTGVQTEQCPAPYTNDTSKGERFFVYDPSFPDRFGFVFKGSTFVLGTTGSSSWFQSLQFN